MVCSSIEQYLRRGGKVLITQPEGGCQFNSGEDRKRRGRVGKINAFTAYSNRRFFEQFLVMTVHFGDFLTGI